MSNYLNKVHDFIFEPREVFSSLKSEPKLSQGLFTLVWVSIFVHSLHYVLTANILNVFWFLFTLINYIFGVIFSWFMAGLFFEYIAKIFGSSGRLKTILYLSSFAILPFLFLAPLELLKKGGDLGYFLGAIFEVIIYLWTMFLYCKSLEITYDLKFSRAVMLIFLPFIATFFAISWAIGFYVNLFYIFNV